MASAMASFLAWNSLFAKPPLGQELATPFLPLDEDHAGPTKDVLLYGYTATKLELAHHQDTAPISYVRLG
jgi:hypothetical protein